MAGTDISCLNEFAVSSGSGDCYLVVLGFTKDERSTAQVDPVFPLVGVLALRTNLI